MAFFCVLCRWGHADHRDTSRRYMHSAVFPRVLLSCYPVRLLIIALGYLIVFIISMNFFMMLLTCYNISLASGWWGPLFLNCELWHSCGPHKQVLILHCCTKDDPSFLNQLVYIPVAAEYMAMLAELKLGQRGHGPSSSFILSMESLEFRESASSAIGYASGSNVTV